MKKKKVEMKVTYRYIKPKTPQQAEEAKRRLEAAYDILFDAMLASEIGKRPEIRKFLQ